VAPEDCAGDAKGTCEGGIVEEGQEPQGTGEVVTNGPGSPASRQGSRRGWCRRPKQLRALPSSRQRTLPVDELRRGSGGLWSTVTGRTGYTGRAAARTCRTCRFLRSA